MFRLCANKSEKWQNVKLHQKGLISRIDSRTLRDVNILGLLDFSNNIKNAYYPLGLIEQSDWNSGTHVSEKCPHELTHSLLRLTS